MFIEVNPGSATENSAKCVLHQTFIRKHPKPVFAKKRHYLTDAFNITRQTDAKIILELRQNYTIPKVQLRQNFI